MLFMYVTISVMVSVCVCVCVCMCVCLYVCRVKLEMLGKKESKEKRV